MSFIFYHVECPVCKTRPDNLNILQNNNNNKINKIIKIKPKNITWIINPFVLAINLIAVIELLIVHLLRKTAYTVFSNNKITRPIYVLKNKS